jgi:hypothetical protein
MGEFKPTIPQTNLSIVEYYQRLAYKYKNWLSEFNKYEVFIPTEKNERNEEVPSHLMPNKSIKFIRKLIPYIPG